LLVGILYNTIYMVYRGSINGGMPLRGAGEPIFGADGYSKAKMRLQSFFMLTTIQPSLIASS
jgi:hypothetical protein